MFYDKFLEDDKIPDFLIRFGIRKLLRQRIKDETKATNEAQKQHLIVLIEELKIQLKDLESYAYQVSFKRRKQHVESSF